MDLFGHDKKSARATGDYVDPRPGYQLPQAPPVGSTPFPQPSVAMTMPPLNGLPSAPPPTRGRPGAFDRDHRDQTLLAMAAGFFGSNGLADGLANASKAIAQGNAAARTANKPQLGGPDSAFEVYTDPITGEHTFKPIQAAVDYLHDKREKAKDVADLNGRVMMAISQLPKEDQAAAFADVRANPDIYGVQADRLPQTWSPSYGKIAGTTGMTVSQALTRNQATENEQHREAHRDIADADRAKRTDIQGRRAAASTAQGAARVGIAKDALGLRKNGGGKNPVVTTMSTPDLLKLAFGH